MWCTIVGIFSLFNLWLHHWIAQTKKWNFKVFLAGGNGTWKNKVIIQDAVILFFNFNFFYFSNYVRFKLGLCSRWVTSMLELLHNRSQPVICLRVPLPSIWRMKLLNKIQPKYLDNFLAVNFLYGKQGHPGTSKIPTRNKMKHCIFTLQDLKQDLHWLLPKKIHVTKYTGYWTGSWALMQATFRSWEAKKWISVLNGDFIVYT